LQQTAELLHPLLLPAATHQKPRVRSPPLAAFAMRPDEPLAASCAVLVNNKAFVNSNGWPFGLLVSPQPPQSLPSPSISTPPPAWLAIGMVMRLGRGGW